MRGLWHTVALMAQNRNNFITNLTSVAKTFTDARLAEKALITAPGVSPEFFLELSQQPDRTALQQIDSLIRQTNSRLRLCAYELAEVNRFTIISAKSAPQNKDLSDYWKGLGTFPLNWADEAGFMEAVGGLASDPWTRGNFALGNFGITKWFDVSHEQEVHLRSMLQPASLASNAADRFERSSWPNPTCGSRVDAADPSNWSALNV